MFGPHNVQNALAAIAVGVRDGHRPRTIRARWPPSPASSAASPSSARRRHHRDRRLRPPSGRDRRRPEAPRASARRHGRDRRRPAAPLLPPARPVRRLLHLLQRRRYRASSPTSTPPARQPIEGVDRDGAGGGPAHARPSPRRAAPRYRSDLPSMICTMARPGDFVVCLGAGNITAWAHALPGQLSACSRQRVRAHRQR